MRGTLRRLEKLDGHADEYGVSHYWQGWLEPAGGPASPVIVHFLRIPEGMPEGLEIMEPVVVSGFFLKNMAYRAADGVRIAPLIVSLAPVRPRLASADAQTGGFWERSIGLIGVGTMLAIVSMVGIGYLLVGFGRRRRLEADSLDPETFSGKAFSISESLRSLALTDADSDGGHTGGADSE
jgi:hypothetical protein